jgi:hypothetical protein
MRPDPTCSTLKSGTKHPRVVSGAAAKQRPVGGQAEPGHSQQGARAPADPSAPRGKHRVWGGLGVGAPAMCPRPPTHMSISCRPSLYPPRRTPLLHFKRSPWYPSPSFVNTHDVLGLSVDRSGWREARSAPRRQFPSEGQIQKSSTPGSWRTCAPVWACARTSIDAVTRGGSIEAPPKKKRVRREHSPIVCVFLVV